MLIFVWGKKIVQAACLDLFLACFSEICYALWIRWVFLCKHMVENKQDLV